MPNLLAISTAPIKAAVLSCLLGPVLATATLAEDEPLSEYLRLQRSPESTSAELRQTLSTTMSDMTTQGQTEEMTRALAQLPFWATENTAASVQSLFDAAQAGQISENLANRAARKADNQLDDIRRENADSPFDAYKRLTALEAEGTGYPWSYKLLLRLYRVSAIEQALMAVPGADISSPISVWRDATLTGELPAATKEASDVLDSLIAEYQKPEYADKRERFFLNDLRHRAVLIRFLAGRDDWISPLFEIAAASDELSDWYDPDAVLDHIYVNQFFAINDTELRTDPQAGTAVVNTAPKDAATLENLRVRRNFNPLQLAAWSCDTLGEAQERDLSVLDILNRLGSFQNADYRVVLGHHDGSNGRFSGTPVAQLKALADEALNSLPGAAREPRSDFAATARKLQDDATCGQIVAKHPVGAVTIVEGAVDKGNQYIALGGMLDAAQAQGIERTLKATFGKRGFPDGGPYLLRPGTNG